jgi:thioester reductase-like protein
MVPARIAVLERMPINANGKVDRKALARTAQTLVPRIQSAAVRVAPSNDLEAALCEEFTSVLGVEVGMTDNFFDLGGHSLMATKLATRISRRLDVRLSVKDFINNPTVAGLSSLMISESRAVGNTEILRIHSRSGQSIDESAVSWARDRSRIMQEMRELAAQLPASIPARFFVPESPPKSLFLTGGTGYFGTALLHHLVRNDHVERVTILVRASSPETARTRIVDAAVMAGWWDDKYVEKIHCWTGDLRQPQLGLTNSQWLELSTGTGVANPIDGIIHNGAKVNFYHNYDRLRAVNVMSTYQLFSLFSTNSYLKTFVYVSTAPWQDTSDLDTANLSSLQILESASGYACSKLAAEYILSQCAQVRKCTSRPVLVVKPGFIIGNPTTGIANTDDFVWRVVACCVTMGCFPQEPTESYMFMSSLDGLAATTIENLSSASGRMAKVKSLAMQTSKFWESVNTALALRLKAKPVRLWQQQLLLCDKTSMLAAHHPIFPVLHMVTQTDQIFGQVLGEPNIDPSEIGGQVQEELSAAIVRNVKYLSDVGYFLSDREKRPSRRLFDRTRDVKEV